MAIMTKELNDTLLAASAKCIEGPVYGSDVTVPFLGL